MTNKEKFREVFGFAPNNGVINCIIPLKVCEEQKNCSKCPFSRWWDMEYKECFVIKEKYDEKM